MLMLLPLTPISARWTSSHSHRLLRKENGTNSRQGGWADVQRKARASTTTGSLPSLANFASSHPRMTFGCLPWTIKINIFHHLLSRSRGPLSIYFIKTFFHFSDFVLSCTYLFSGEFFGFIQIVNSSFHQLFSVTRLHLTITGVHTILLSLSKSISPQKSS